MQLNQKYRIEVGTRSDIDGDNYDIYNDQSDFDGLFMPKESIFSPVIPSGRSNRASVKEKMPYSRPKQNMLLPHSCMLTRILPI